MICYTYYYYYNNNGSNIFEFAESINSLSFNCFEFYSFDFFFVQSIHGLFNFCTRNISHRIPHVFQLCLHNDCILICFICWFNDQLDRNFLLIYYQSLALSQSRLEMIIISCRDLSTSLCWQTDIVTALKIFRKTNTIRNQQQAKFDNAM